MSAAWQVWLPSLVLGLLNAGVVAAAAPMLDALRAGTRRLVAGPASGGFRAGTVRGIGAGWRELSRLAARPCLRPDGAGPVLRGSPAASVAVSLVPLPLLPGLATWPGLGRVADLPTILVLLAAGRAAALLGAMEAGTAAPALRTQAGLLGMARGAIGAIVASVALFAVAGELGLEHVIATLRSAAVWRGGAGVLLSGALAAAALSANDEVPDGAWSGSDLAAHRYAAMLRGAAWVELVSALLLPGWIGAPGTDASRWSIVALGWAARLAIGSVVLGMLQQVVARFGLRRTMLGWSVLLSVLAVVVGGMAPGGSE